MWATHPLIDPPPKLTHWAGDSQPRVNLGGDGISLLGIWDILASLRSPLLLCSQVHAFFTFFAYIIFLNGGLDTCLAPSNPLIHVQVDMTICISNKALSSIRSLIDSILELESFSPINRFCYSNFSKR